MEAVELLKLGESLLKVMSSFDLKVDDWKHIAMYEDYCRMKKDGAKYSYILLCLSEKYCLSESSVKRIIRRFSVEVNF